LKGAVDVGVAYYLAADGEAGIEETFVKWTEGGVDRGGCFCGIGGHDLVGRYVNEETAVCVLW